VAAEVRPGEGATAVLLAVNVFVLLSAYYTIRPLRSALLLPVEIPLPGGRVMTGPEIQSYTGAILAALFLFIVPLYSALASRVDRMRLINSVTMFFVVTLVAFYFLNQLSVAPTVVAVTFFCGWACVQLMIIAQFWSFANELYTPDQGKRLFAIVGFGGSVGAIGGALIASNLITRVGLLPMMLIGSVELVIALVLTNLIHRREQRRPKAVVDKTDEQPLSGGGGFKLGAQQPLSAPHRSAHTAVQLVNTNGNYILNETLARTARDTSAGTGHRKLIHRQLHGRLDFGRTCCPWSSSSSGLTHLQVLGIGGALFVMPIISYHLNGLFAFARSWRSSALTKIAENATDNSLQNTVRRALFLPTSREEQSTRRFRLSNILLASGRHAVRCLHLRPHSVAGHVGPRFRAGETSRSSSCGSRWRQASRGRTAG
jgi:AAA family ATP:ADP antiporter